MKSKPKPATLADRIRSRREALGLTQAELAAAVGNNCTQARVSGWERGMGPAVRWLAAIAAALKIDVAELLG